MIRALLLALLEPIALLRKSEAEGDLTARLAWQEEAKTLPSAAVWDFYCLQADVPVGAAWLDNVRQYEQDVLFQR
jgi:L-rhamnose isomerase